MLKKTALTLYGKNYNSTCKTNRYYTTEIMFIQ